MLKNKIQLSLFEDLMFNGLYSMILELAKIFWTLSLEKQEEMLENIF